MIYKQCILTINGNNAKLDEDIYLFRLDKNIELYFTIVNNKYKFNKSDLNNIINLTNASYFQMRLYKNAEVKYTFAIQPTDNGKAILTITDDLIDEPIEVGDYDFQISLLDADKSSMISLPIVSKQIHVCEPLVTDASETGTAVLGLSTLESGEIVDAFDEEGNYIRKVHVNGELISAELFNKWEEALETNSSNIKTLDSQFKDIGNKKANKNEIKIIVNVKSFGAKGDGTTNDSPSINNALAYAKANKIMNVYIPEGQYIIDESPIKVHSGITFYGDGSDDPYNCGGTRLYGGNNLNGPIVTNDNTLYHFKWFDMQVRNGKSHGAYLIDLGENSYIDRVAFYDNRGDGLRIGSNGNLTPCHLGHISVHKNDGAGIRFENISSTQIQVLYLSMDNNKDCGMSIDIGDTSSNFQLLAWKSERWKNDQADYQDRQKTIFKIHNLNGGTVHLGQGRVHLGNNMDNSDGGVIHQTCEEGNSVGYVMWDCITKSSNANNLAYAFGYKDDKNNETISFEDILRKTFISGHTIQLAQARGTLIEIGRADTKFYFGKATSLPTFNTPYGSLVIIGNKIYLNTNNATKFDRIVNNNFDEDFIIKANKGVVLTSSNYTKYRLKVDNDGNLSTELVND